MEKYVRVINKDKESETVKSVDCFPASNIKQLYFNSIEDEDHKRVYYIKIVDVVGTICVYATRREDECYDAFELFYSWLLDGESNEFVFTIDRTEVNNYFKNYFF